MPQPSTAPAPRAHTSLAAEGLAGDGGEALATSPYAGRAVITYKVDLSTLPSSLRERSKTTDKAGNARGTDAKDIEDKLDEDIGKAFARWEGATGVHFTRGKESSDVDIVLSFTAASTPVPLCCESANAASPFSAVATPIWAAGSATFA